MTHDESVVWTNAKSYPDAPHEHIVRERYPKTHARLVVLIKKHGVMESFTLRGTTRQYRYWYAGDGYKYWHMDDIINRARVTPVG